MKPKHYAVRIGREGPKLYDSWDQCKANVHRYPGAIYKSFASLVDAQEWLSGYTSLQVTTKEDSDSEIEFLPGPSRITLKPLDNAKHVDSSDSDIEIIDPPPVHENYNRPRKRARTDDVDDEGPNPLPIAKIVLSPEQNDILNRVKAGHSVFFTGSAGTGKSVLLREIIAARGGRVSSTLAITASTGIASVNIGGTTLHSWAGIGLGEETAERITGKFYGQRVKFEKVIKRWNEVQTLIIDEISMIDGVLFDKLEEIARILRHNEKPFGGIQLVLSGDFCQLPPVPDRRKMAQSSFAFDARSWYACVGSPIVLSQVFRQKDQEFVTMLNAMRFGNVSGSTLSAFRALSRKVNYPDMIEPTELFATRYEVDQSNMTRLAKLSGKAVQYRAVDLPGLDSNGKRVSSDNMARLLDRLVTPSEITLKVGAQVMLIKNLQQGRLVNGSVATVVGFSTASEAIKKGTDIGRVESAQNGSEALRLPKLPPDREWPLVRFISGQTLLCIPQDFTVNNSSGSMEAQRTQIPLILAWALSVHKSQGQTLERVKVDLSKTFEKGQAYVALSRATTMANLQVLNFDPTKVVAHPRVIAWYQQARSDETFSDED